MSEQQFSVAIHYGDDHRGYIDYDAATKVAEVHLEDEVWRKKVEDYLHGTYTIDDALSLSEYTPKEISPLDSVDSLKLALTRMWEEIEVQVDWSWPVNELR